MPMSLMEAMTAGCIPIVFNNSALPYMVENGSTGFVCENLNTESYAKCIVDYYAMKQSDRIKLRKQACEKAAAYIRSWDEVADEFWKVIEK
jgi:glycosyltransferase involved in cell wall biosynthesis